MAKTTIDSALHELIQVAAELVICRELPDVHSRDFRPMGKKAVQKLEAEQLRRGRRIRDAVDAIRKIQQET